MSEIKKIKLHHNTNITNATLNFIAQKFRDLTSLDISECDHFNLTIDGLYALARSCPQLTYINVTLCPSLHIRDYLRKFQAKYPNLNIIDNTPDDTSECF